MIFSLQGDMTLHLSKFEVIFQRCFVPRLVEFDPVVLQKRKMYKVYDNANKDDAYNEQSLSKRSLEPLA